MPVNKKIRELDGVFFRIERDGKFKSICYSDMTRAERQKFTRHHHPEDILEGVYQSGIKEVAKLLPADLKRVFVDYIADSLYGFVDQLEFFNDTNKPKEETWRA